MAALEATVGLFGTAKSIMIYWLKPCCSMPSQRLLA